MLESKLAMKNGAEGSSVDVNMQQLQVRSRTCRLVAIETAVVPIIDAGGNGCPANTFV